MRRTVELGVLNTLSYFILTADIRSVSQGNIPAALAVNALVAWLTFSIFKRMQTAESIPDRIAYTVGGATGTVIGIVLTKALFGH